MRQRLTRFRVSLVSDRVSPLKRSPSCVAGESAPKKCMRTSCHLPVAACGRSVPYSWSMTVSAGGQCLVRTELTSKGALRRGLLLAVPRRAVLRDLLLFLRLPLLWREVIKVQTWVEDHVWRAQVGVKRKVRGWVVFGRLWRWEGGVSEARVPIPASRCTSYL